jgi:hypothetical protein
MDCRRFLRSLNNNKDEDDNNDDDDEQKDSIEQVYTILLTTILYSTSLITK